MGGGELFSPELLAELGANNEFFDNLVDMIPAKLYVSGNTGDEAYNPKYRKGQHKESKEARRARNKQAKLAKYDPNLAESTMETKKRKEQEAYEDSDSSDSEDDASNPIHDNHEEEDEEEMEDAKTPSTSPNANANANNETDTDTNSSNNNNNIPDGLSRIEALRAKLHSKIAEKRARSNRTCSGFDDINSEPHNKDGNANAQAVSKRAARRAQKQRLKQIAIARKKGGHSSANQNKGNVTVTHTLASSSSDDPTKNNKQSKSTTTASSLKDDLAGINFGSIAGLNSTEYYKDNKSLAGEAKKKKKSLDRLLKEAEDKQKRLQELKSSDNQDDKEKAKRILWGDTLKEATGERIRDDPKQIKKAMKRKLTKKAKSAQAWKTRIDKTKDSMLERQQVRQHNIGQRKVGGAAGANLSKKRIVTQEEEGEGKKRRRMGPHAEKSRAGFEGKKQGFINKEKGGGGD